MTPVPHAQPTNRPHGLVITLWIQVMLAWQMPVPGIARLFYMKHLDWDVFVHVTFLLANYLVFAVRTCSFLEELSDFPPWAKKCDILQKLMSEIDDASD